MLLVAVAAEKPAVGAGLARATAPSAAELALLDPASRRLFDEADDPADALARLIAARRAVVAALGPARLTQPAELELRGLESTSVPARRVEIALGGEAGLLYPEFNQQPLAVHTLRDGDLVVATVWAEIAD